MARYVISIATPMPAEESFAYLAEVTRYGEWDPSIKRAVRVRGDGHGLNTAYDLTVKTLTESVMRYEVKEYVPPRRLVIVAKTAFLTSHDEVTVEARGSGSVVTYDALLTLRGPLKIFDLLLGAAFKPIGDRAAAGLERQLKGQILPSARAEVPTEPVGASH